MPKGKKKVEQSPPTHTSQNTGAPDVAAVDSTRCNHKAERERIGSGYLLCGHCKQEIPNEV